ncbi:MAG: hypothetical protein K8F36_14045 [Melioribacteraceae bacterium]|nr:hypothetical protein [Melioribacteraceae bacterium]
MKKSLFVLAAIFFSFINYTFAQCSDAGICSLGGHSIEQKTNTFDLSIGYSYGYSGKEDDIAYSSVKLNGLIYFTADTKFNVITPYNFQSGPLGNVNGIGDLIISLSQSYTIYESRLTFSAGLKFATGDENKEPSLPLAYQNGLGTNDLLLGIDYSFSNFTFGIGYQLAGKRNENSQTYLKRGDDLLIRGEYTFIIEKFNINPQLLFIKRISKSNVLYNGTLPESHFFDVDGSDHSQLNLLISTFYEINNMHSLFLEAAVPLLERDINIDGLKRTFTISTRLSFGF